tara:strand:+ start:1134 stop:1721 length:588 start_codon:yes stop_codon:yes gene_type:complete
MTQDFAKIKPEPILERKTLEPPPAWSLLFTGGLVGMTVGVFACVLFYLSGRVPPLELSRKTDIALSNQPSVQSGEITPNERSVDFEFYTELPKYVVQTDAIPVEVQDSLSTNTQKEITTNDVMLQTGAFQQLASAELEMRRLIALGLSAKVKPAKLPGKTLYLVQNGPYSSQSELDVARKLLEENNIATLVVQLQ